ncbi:MAG: hypothetical protein RR056_02715 [Acetivibrio sp.]
MIYVAIAFILLVVLVCKLYMDEKNLKKKIEVQLRENWGQVPIQEYSYEKMDSISKYYQSKKEASFDVDDITWNDLDMDRIFMLINHTESSIGEEYLYSLLRKLQFSEDKLVERNRLITFFTEHEKERFEVLKKLRMIGKLKNLSFFEYVNRADSLEVHKPYFHFICMLLIPLSIASIFIPGLESYSLFAIAGALIFNITTYYRCKAAIEIYFNVFSYLLRSLEFMEELSKLEIPELDSYMKELKEQVKQFKRFRRGAYLVVSKKVSGSLQDILLDYVRMLFHVDLIKFDNMVKELHDKKENLNQLFEIVGLLDSMLGVSSFRKLFQDEYCLPSLKKDEKIYYEAEDLYHPFIINPVKNSLKTERSILLTGSNASGKSTFIKTMAINSILAQTIYTSLSRSFQSNYFKIYSSMALRDDIMAQESYYIVEIKSLKRIYDESGDNVPILCFVDEVLRGTNTAERIAASSQILKNLSYRNALCVAATHDIELTYILEKYFNNYHFQEKIEENKVLFDYLIHTGRATSRNAIKLLGMIGYSETIIEEATKEVDHFLNCNSWNTL